MTDIRLEWQDGGHDPLDFEPHQFVKPRPTQIAARAQFSSLTAIFDHYGIEYTEEPGWKEREQGYDWYEGGPFGVMVHHTVSVPYPAGSAYPAPEGNRTDGKVICNILIQPDGVVNLIAAGPANYSSGMGQEELLDEYVKEDLRYDGPQSGPYPEGWYGNRAYINIETVASGDGGPIPQAQENAVIATCAALCYLQDWSAWRCVAHADHRGTKIDPRWTAEYGVAPYTIAGLQDKIHEILTLGLDPNEPDEGEGMDTERWATRLRNPLDFQRMVDVGVITQDEMNYWVGVDTASPEMQDLRDAVDVRTPLWAGK